MDLKCIKVGHDITEVTNKFYFAFTNLCKFFKIILFWASASSDRDSVASQNPICLIISMSPIWAHKRVSMQSLTSNHLIPH